MQIPTATLLDFDLWPLLNSNDILGLLKKYREKIGKICRMHVGLRPVNLIMHPAAARYILQENNQNYYKSSAYNHAALLLGDGLVTSDGEIWKKQRRTVQPMFMRSKIAAWHNLMLKAVKETALDWEDAANTGQNRDLHADMTLLTLRIIARTMFSREVGDIFDEVRENISEVNELINRRITSLVNIPIEFPVPDNIRLRKIIHYFDNLIADIMHERRSKNNSESSDLLGLLMNAADPETGQKMPDKQIRDEVLTIFLAGHETTSTVLTMFWVSQAQNPNVRKKLLDSLHGVSLQEDISEEQLSEFSYLQNCIEETLRLYPAAWIIGRRAYKPDQVMGYDIEPHVDNEIPISLIHRDPDYFSEPDKFIPERFTDTAKFNKAAYFPFGAGPRTCIGNLFAMKEMLIATSYLSVRFFPEPVESEVKLLPLFTLRPEKEVYAKIRRVS